MMELVFLVWCIFLLGLVEAGEVFRLSIVSIEKGASIVKDPRNPSLGGKDPKTRERSWASPLGSSNNAEAAQSEIFEVRTASRWWRKEDSLGHQVEKDGNL
jgi:hypothetical protein